MPGETSPVDQKTQFIADYLHEALSATDLCDGALAVSLAFGSAIAWLPDFHRHS